MLIKLSIDIWRDIFDWFSSADRKPLALKSNQIYDREFCDICQKWLHEWTKNVCIGKLKIYSMFDSKVAYLCVWGPAVQYSTSTACGTTHHESAKLIEWWNPVNDSIAETELPINIGDFKEINLCYMDTMVLQFLRRMRPLFHNINLTVSCNSTKSLEANTIALGHVMPLITDGIKTCYIVNKQILYTIRDRFPDHFFAIAQLQVLIREEDAASTIEFVELLLPWLCTRRDDGLPRMLKIPTFFGNALEFVERIRQNFLIAASPVSFFIRCWISSPLDHVQESTNWNAGTREQMMVRKPKENVLLIGRCSSDLDGQAWSKVKNAEAEATKQETQGVIFIRLQAIGPIEEA